MKKKFTMLKACMIMLVLSMLHLVAVAQSGLIKGLVRNSKNELLPGVSVLVQRNDSTTVASTATNPSGAFTITGLQSGSNYTFTFSFVGYESQKKVSLTPPPIYLI